MGSRKMHPQETKQVWLNAGTEFSMHYEHRILVLHVFTAEPMVVCVTHNSAGAEKDFLVITEKGSAKWPIGGIPFGMNMVDFDIKGELDDEIVLDQIGSCASVRATFHENKHPQLIGRRNKLER
jgi:hypothetical protein